MKEEEIFYADKTTYFILNRDKWLKFCEKHKGNLEMFSQYVIAKQSVSYMILSYNGDNVSGLSIFLATDDVRYEVPDSILYSPNSTLACPRCNLEQLNSLDEYMYDKELKFEHKNACLLITELIKQDVIFEHDRPIVGTVHGITHVMKATPTYFKNLGVGDLFATTKNDAFNPYAPGRLLFRKITANRAKSVLLLKKTQKYELKWHKRTDLVYLVSRFNDTNSIPELTVTTFGNLENNELFSKVDDPKKTIFRKTPDDYAVEVVCKTKNGYPTYPMQDCFLKTSILACEEIIHYTMKKEK